MAEKDRKAGYDAEQHQQPQQQLARPQQEPQQQTDRGNVSQQAAELMLAILQQVQTQIRSGTLNLTGEIDPEQLRRAAFAGAAYRTIENGLALLPAVGVDTVVSPPSGSKSGGFSMSIPGKNFLPGSRVILQSGDTRAALDNVDVLSETEIQGTAPPFPTTGAVDVVVVTSLGEGRKVSGFTYTA